MVTDSLSRILRMSFVSTVALFGGVWLSAIPAAAADDSAPGELSVTFSGPVVWEQDDAENPRFSIDTTISMTCAGDACTIGWPAAHYGAPPTWQRGQNRISQVTPASGDLCAGTYRWAVNLNLTITRDHIIGTVDRAGTEVDCSATEHRIAHAASATIDIPLVSGDPCIVDRNVACSAEQSEEPETSEAVSSAEAPGTSDVDSSTAESAAPVAVASTRSSATPSADKPDDKSTTSDSSTDDGVPIALIVGGAAAVAAAGAATTVAVQRNRAGRTAQAKDQLTSDAHRSSERRSDVVDNSSGYTDTNLTGEPGGPPPGAESVSGEGAGTQPDGGQGDRVTRGGTSPSTGAGSSGTGSTWDSVSNLPGADSPQVQQMAQGVSDTVNHSMNQVTDTAGNMLDGSSTPSSTGAESDLVTRGGATPSGGSTAPSAGGSPPSSGTTGAANTSSPWSSVGDLTSNLPGADSTVAQNIGEQVADIVNDVVGDIKDSIPPLKP